MDRVSSYTVSVVRDYLNLLKGTLNGNLLFGILSESSSEF